MKKAIFFLTILVAGCSTKNPLAGTWISDDDRTLAELKAMDAPPSLVLACFEKGICGNTEVRYTSDTYTTISRTAGGRVLSEESAPYNLVESAESYVIIDQHENGGKIKIYFLNESTMYVQSERRFNDYYVRQ